MASVVCSFNDVLARPSWPIRWSPSNHGSISKLSKRTKSLLDFGGLNIAESMFFLKSKVYVIQL
jgi:hypothetical protein